MKRIYLTLWSLLTACCLVTAAYAQEGGELKLATAKEYGENLSFFPKTASKEKTIYVDWGDGNKKAYNIDPNGMAFFSKVSGKLLSDTVRIYAELVSMDCAECDITYLSTKDLPKLVNLNANGNKLTSENLILDGAENLEILDLSNNDVSLLDLSEFQSLRLFSAYNNPRLGAVAFPEYSETLQSISLNKCDISRFNPIELPALTSLDLSECALMDLEIGNYYPALSSLNVSGNYINALNVTTLSELETLNVSENQLSEINVTQNPKLVNFFCNNNHLKELNIKHNTKLSNLSCEHNELTVLNVTTLPALYRLECGYNQLSRLDISQNPSLDRLTCAENQLEFLDFTGNPRMNFIDCRNNSKMTSNTVNYMFSTLLARYRDAWSANLLVEGCNAEHADMSEVNSAEMKWKTDVEGDGTARFTDVAITQVPAQNGTYTLSQSTLYGKEYQTVTDKAKNGTPIKIVAHPETDYVFDDALVNGPAVRDSLFVVEDAAQVEVPRLRG